MSGTWTVGRNWGYGVEIIAEVDGGRRVVAHAEMVEDAWRICDAMALAEHLGGAERRHDESVRSDDPEKIRARACQPERAEADRLRALLVEVLGRFADYAYVGRSAVRTPWLNVETVTAWREAASADHEKSGP